MNKRNALGRRRSDWIIPLLLVVVAGLATVWALRYRAQQSQAQKLNAIYRHTLDLSNRTIEARDRELEGRAATPQGAAPQAAAPQAVAPQAAVPQAAIPHAAVAPQPSAPRAATAAPAIAAPADNATHPAPN
jgi:hypothetical protein